MGITLSHLHPVVVHFALGFTLLWLLKEQLPLKGRGGSLAEEGIKEAVFLSCLLGIGTGWLALAWDWARQFSGQFFWPGAIHETLGICAVGILGWHFFLARREKGENRFPRTHLILLVLFLSLGFTGEWLVFGYGATGR
jgi:uncharacterized membrane protein|uniref:DUF2231 domain-containing protein n=1 Tax=Leptospirillum ferriphilum TaxID=178606 RepID=A0A7C3LR25_9BACT